MSSSEAEKDAFGGDEASDAVWDRVFAADGKARLAVLDEEIASADLRSDVDLGFQLRLQLIEDATFGQEADRALIAFDWVLARYDREPEFAAYQHEVLWRFKWIGGHIHEFHQVTLAQIERTFSEMERLYRAAGSSIRAVHKLRALAWADLGDTERARADYDRWIAEPSDDSTDCEACEVNGQVQFLVVTGRDAEAIEVAAPVLQGKMRCHEVPAATHSWLLMPAVRLGRLKEAFGWHKASMSAVSGFNDILHIAQHLAFLSLYGNFTRAVRLIERHTADALRTRQGYFRFHYCSAAWLVFQRLAQTGRTQVRVKLPASMPLYREDGRHEIANLTRWFQDDARATAKALDHRRGTDHFSRLLETHRALADLAEIKEPQ